jgi:hypothetical protein
VLAAICVFSILSANDASALEVFHCLNTPGAKNLKYETQAKCESRKELTPADGEWEWMKGKVKLENWQNSRAKDWVR